MKVNTHIKKHYNTRGATSVIYLQDCVEGMKQYPDNHFDLAVVDPPYGIGISSGGSYYNLKGKRANNPHKKKDWDSEIPSTEYWNQIFRVSKNQIVWGGNYMTEYLHPSRCWIFWDKMKYVPNYADGELAWTSFDLNTKKIQLQHHGFMTSDRKNEGVSSIHPTQKPVALYDWIFKNYAKEGDKILDTHLGSGSNRIAAHKAGLDFTGFELDEEYFDASVKRFREYENQLTLF